jgi:hypothetical protein
MIYNKKGEKKRNERGEKTWQETLAAVERERERERELQFSETKRDIVQQSDTHTHQ